ncbi:hypothetical protein Vretifemale_19510 [Volvox reticuliferus]|uniref:Uncharacterized protein n=1 Tax=Volvox reticuliferus TaxID=1737510 RepID=A0A8J4D1M6_9CHLO|nr:hypothetical protein Vretifemale_19510 [Volvox reticuliferus]
MDIQHAVAYMDKFWSEIEPTICLLEDGLIVDAAIMAAIICMTDLDLFPVEDSLVAAIIEVLITFLKAEPQKNGSMYIPCNVSEIKSLKEFILQDAISLLPPTDGNVTPREGCTAAAKQISRTAVPNINSAQSSHASAASAGLGAAGGVPVVAMNTEDQNVPEHKNAAIRTVPPEQLRGKMASCGIPPLPRTVNALRPPN